MNPKVSIIVPIFNMEQYLGRCLDSLLSQTMRDIEIVAVNDGSTDSTEEILNRYKEKDARIIVVDKKNGGVSSARNEGIKVAAGEYIGFVDPDDWVNPKMYEILYNTATVENGDIVMCSYTREFGTHSKNKHYPLPKFVRFDSEEVKAKMMRRLIGPLNEEIGNPEMLDAWGTVWSKVYRKELIQENNIQFVNLEQIGTNEDTLFNIQACYYANSFIFLNSPLYHYWRANSNSVTSGYKPNLLNQWLHLYSLIEYFLAEKKIKTEYKQALDNRICLNMLGLGLNTLGKGNDQSVLKKIRHLKKVLTHERVRQSFQQFKLKHLPIVWKVFYFFAKNRFATGFYSMLVTIELMRKTVR